MKKRLFALVLALCLLLGSSAMAEAALIENINVASNMPVVNEPISVTIAVVPQNGAQDFKAERNWMCQYLDKYSGLDIEWMVIDPATAGERIPVMLNSGSMPDAIIGYSYSANDIVQYGVSDMVFRPVEDLLVYMPALSALIEENPAILSAMTATDGHAYGFPALPNLWSFNLRFFINTVWLEKVGMENPKTLEELKQVLIAFRDGDPNGNGEADEIPWVGAWSEQQPERRVVLNAYGYVDNGANIAVDYSGEETKLVYMPYAEHYKDFLIYMNDLWNEGLLDPDMFTQAETQAQATVLEGVTGFMGMSAPYVYDPENQDDWDCLNVLVDTEGDTPVIAGPKTLYNVSRFAINADVDDETAAALANLADWFYTLEGWAFATYGPEAGSDLDWNGDGHYYDAEGNTILYNMPEDMTSAWTHRITNLTIYSNPGLNAEAYDPYRLKYAEVYPDSAVGQQFKDGIVDRLDSVQQKEKQSPYYVEAVPDLFFSEDDLNRLNELQIPLDDYVASMEAKFITGEASIEEEYDEFIATLESYGAAEYQEIYDTYYQAYKAN